MLRSLKSRLGRTLGVGRPACWQPLVAAIATQEARLKELTDQALRKESLALRYRSKSGKPAEDMLIEAYALVREAARRTLGMRHYDVQMIGGIAMFHRCIAVMQTGEGKTLTATLPLYLRALAGRGSHLATANDYLAERDAKWMEPVYKALGISVGIVTADVPPRDRPAAYAADITYGTAKEFGFDFLRDRLALRTQEEGTSDLLGGMLGIAQKVSATQTVQRGHHFALVDEADSMMIDEARTPLIISSLPDQSQESLVTLYRWAAQIAPQLEDDKHYTRNRKERSLDLTAEGRRFARQIKKPENLAAWDMNILYQHLERAALVLHEFQRDRHYIIREHEAVIVDEFTGRLAEGRRWRDGVHQAVEAKEGLEISLPTAQAARVTIQDYFCKYEHLGGMTGTIANSGPELADVYSVHALEIPTQRPPKRRKLPDVVFATAAEKCAAIVAEVKEVHATGRPVLVGTRSIDKSETISQLLTSAGIEHQVLNARFVAEEAEIVAAAGEKHKVTIATNMAGRGTDVKLGPGVEELGGLHVICSELHDSARIDRQLIGRCGRQGDPGTYRQMLALDDDILINGLGNAQAKKIAEAARTKLNHLAPLFSKAQAIVERQHYSQRRVLMHHEAQRQAMQRRMGLDPYLDTPS